MLRRVARHAAQRLQRLESSARSFRRQGSGRFVATMPGPPRSNEGSSGWSLLVAGAPAASSSPSTISSSSARADGGARTHRSGSIPHARASISRVLLADGVRRRSWSTRSIQPRASSDGRCGARWSPADMVLDVLVGRACRSPTRTRASSQRLIRPRGARRQALATQAHAVLELDETSTHLGRRRPAFHGPLRSERPRPHVIRWLEARRPAAGHRPPATAATRRAAGHAAALAQPCGTVARRDRKSTDMSSSPLAGR